MMMNGSNGGGEITKVHISIGVLIGVLTLLILGATGLITVTNILSGRLTAVESSISELRRTNDNNRADYRREMDENRQDISKLRDIARDLTTTVEILNKEVDAYEKRIDRKLDH
jgi:hypothetical protein